MHHLFLKALDRVAIGDDLLEDRLVRDVLLLRDHLVQDVLLLIGEVLAEDLGELDGAFSGFPRLVELVDALQHPFRRLVDLLLVRLELREKLLGRRRGRLREPEIRFPGAADRGGDCHHRQQECDARGGADDRLWLSCLHKGPPQNQRIGWVSDDGFFLKQGSCRQPCHRAEQFVSRPWKRRPAAAQVVQWQGAARRARKNPWSRIAGTSLSENVSKKSRSQCQLSSRGDAPGPIGRTWRVGVRLPRLAQRWNAAAGPPP